MKKNETITITRETYDLIKEYMSVLNKLSDAYMLDDRKHDSEIAHINLARWGVSYCITEAIDGNNKSLIDSLESAKTSLKEKTH